MEEDIKGNDTSVATTDEKSKDSKPGVVSVSELFSFAKTRKVWLFIIGAFCCALVSGAVLPGKEIRVVEALLVLIYVNGLLSYLESLSL